MKTASKLMLGVNKLNNFYHIYNTIILDNDCLPSEIIVNKPFHKIISKGGWRLCRVKFNEEYICCRYIVGIIYKIYVYMYFNYIKVGYCTIKTEDEKNSETKEEK